MTLYRIKDWDTHFENNKSRERERCSFACIPNKQDGLGYGMLMREQDGAALYGAFVAVVLMASKQKKRSGWLTANGLPAECPLSARQMSVKTQVPEAVIERMLKVISANEIGWIEAVPMQGPASAHEVPAECPRCALEGKGIEGKEGKGSGSAPRKISAVERIGHERELKAIGRELEKLGSANDYAEGHKNRKRIVELTTRQV